MTEESEQAGESVGEKSGRRAEHWHAEVATYPWFTGMTHPVWEQPQTRLRKRYHVPGTAAEELGDWMLREVETPHSEQTRTVLFSMVGTPETVLTPRGTRETDALTLIGLSPEERAGFVTLFGDLASRAHIVHLDVLHHPLAGIPNKAIRVSAVPGDEARCQPGLCATAGDSHTSGVQQENPLTHTGGESTNNNRTENGSATGNAG